MYQFESRIRYSELDEDGLLALPKIVDYFQDCSTFQSESLGVGLDYLLEHKRVWVMSFWQIQILRRPGIGETVTVGTFPYEFRGFLGMRNFFMKGQDGAMLVQANSVWSLLDTEHFRPVKPEPGMVERYGLEERLPMEYASRKLPSAEGGLMLEPVLVTPDCQDTNHHVNNARYVTMAVNALRLLGKHTQIREMRIEYKNQAHTGDLVYPVVLETEEGFLVRLQDGQGKIYVNLQFLNG